MTLEEIEKEFIIKSRKKVTDWFLRRSGAVESLLIYKRSSKSYYSLWRMGRHFTLPVFVGYSWAAVLQRANQRDI